jgi:hypothetical protein
LDARVGDVQREQSTDMPRHASAERRAYRQFADGLLAFSDDPPANLERYLAASRALEESRRSGRHRRKLELEATPS